MAVLRTIAVKANAGRDRCWAYELAYDSEVNLATVRLGVDDSVRVVGGRCPKPPVADRYGSGVCAWHLARLGPTSTSR
jgi:hypothetical protein